MTWNTTEVHVSRDHGIPDIGNSKKTTYHVYGEYRGFEYEQLVSAKSELSAIRKFLKYVEKEEA